jgi:hypothetical protein
MSSTVRPAFRFEALRSLISRAGSPPQSTFASPACAFTFRSGARLPGFRPSSRLHRPASTCTSTSQALATFRPQAFSASRRFAPRCGLQACSIPLPRPGFTLVQGLLPSRSLFSPHREELPPRRFMLARSPAETGGRTRAPRPRGLAPREVALTHGLVLPAPWLAPLFEFSSPPGASLRRAARFPALLRS